MNIKKWIDNPNVIPVIMILWITGSLLVIWRIEHKKRQPTPDAWRIFLFDGDSIHIGTNGFGTNWPPITIIPIIPERPSPEDRII